MKKKVVAAIMATTIIASMATGAYGATKLQEIKAHLNSGISIKVDGSPVQLKDSNGMAVLPITYNNTTYLPIRAVSDVLNVAVQYDGKTETINLGEKVAGVALAKQFDHMYHTKDPAHTTYKNKDYKEAYYDNASGDRSSNFMLNAKKQYQTLHLEIAAINEPIEQLIISDADNDIILKQIDVINPADGLVTVEADIGGVDSIYITTKVKGEGKVFVPLTTSFFK